LNFFFSRVEHQIAHYVNYLIQSYFLVFHLKPNNWSYPSFFYSRLTFFWNLMLLYLTNFLMFLLYLLNLNHIYFHFGSDDGDIFYQLSRLLGYLILLILGKFLGGQANFYYFKLTPLSLFSTPHYLFVYLHWFSFLLHQFLKTSSKYPLVLFLINLFPSCIFLPYFWFIGYLFHFCQYFVHLFVMIIDSYQMIHFYFYSLFILLIQLLELVHQLIAFSFHFNFSFFLC
jgi:hypothetical protein